MSELLACRVCLGTDVKLYNISEHGLTHSFQTVIGYAIPVSDGLPQHVCCYCVQLLRKCVRFKNIYLEAQDILTRMVLGNQMITTENLRNVHQKYSQLSGLRLSVHHTASVHAYSEEQPLGKENSAIKVEEPCKSEGPEFGALGDCVKSEAEESADAGCSDGGASDNEPLARVQRSKPGKARKQARGGDAPRFPADLNVDVVVLSKEEQIAEVQARRSSANYLSSPLKCELCFKGFLNETTHRNHMQLHDPRAGAYTCDVCRARFPTQRKLRSHARAIHASRFVCRLCRHTANSSYQARLHQKWHQGVTYDCDVCGKSFSKLTTQLTHARLAHRGAHTCALCGAAFRSAAGRRAHEQRAHRTREGGSEAGVRCEPCALQFSSEQALAVHLRTSSKHSEEVIGEMDKHCTSCGETFSRDAALRRHLAAHRSSGARVCDECGVTCKDVRAYSAHYRRAHLPPAPSAPGAPTGAPARAPVRTRDYICELCGTKCSSNATLSYHQRVHSGEKPHACALCPRRFRIYEQLQIHRRGHTGERPFTCSACPKAFMSKAALNRHVRVHTGAKPYPCAHCGKAFSQSNSAKLHVNTVHLRLPQPRRRRAKHTEA